MNVMVKRNLILAQKRKKAKDNPHFTTRGSVYHLIIQLFCLIWQDKDTVGNVKIREEKYQLDFIFRFGFLL